MTTRVQAGVLLVLGAVLVRLAVGSGLASYVRPGTRPLVLAAGGVLCLAGAASGVLRRPPAGASRAGWLLLAPVLTIAIVAPPALGVLTAGRPPVAPPRPSSGFPALPASGPVDIPLSDVVLRTVWHAGKALRDRTLRVIGFVARTTANGFVLARLVITCCAADARPYDIDVADTARAPPPGRWVTVTGRYLGASSAGAVVPALRASRVVPIAQPANPYG
ncbi:TIGR03943 family protein [Jatrophihabitans endophyticus]|uniref:TIGR03943 family putative permease subunit n=1 Tax=Jatrophihabitans endophyticus TaxID=1206085 RepID=UPI0019EE0837|nr:TIGR03943 family protein [Jatrophihabitans endophyticus]MBE7187915.1 TIGR03943 family protein [Jatrophihabitans endophyticus]